MKQKPGRKAAPLFNPTPILPCEGACTRAVGHTRIGEARVEEFATLPDIELSTGEQLSEAAEVIGFEQLYRCSGCGHTRRYGFTVSPLGGEIADAKEWMS